MTPNEINKWLDQLPPGDLLTLLVVCDEENCTHPIGEEIITIEPWRIVTHEDGVLAFQNGRWKQSERRQLVVHHDQLKKINTLILERLEEKQLPARLSNKFDSWFQPPAYEEPEAPEIDNEPLESWFYIDGKSSPIKSELTKVASE